VASLSCLDATAMTLMQSSCLCLASSADLAQRAPPLRATRRSPHPPSAQRPAESGTVLLPFLMSTESTSKVAFLNHNFKLRKEK